MMLLPYAVVDVGTIDVVVVVVDIGVVVVNAVVVVVVAGVVVVVLVGVVVVTVFAALHEWSSRFCSREPSAWKLEA